MLKWLWNALFVISDGKLEVSRYNTLFFVISGSVARKFKDLSSKVFKYSSEVHYITRW